MRLILLVAIATVGTWGCASTSLEVRARRTPEGIIRYEGDLAGPHKTFVRMARTACERMLAARRATPEDERPLGYCAGNFHSPEDNAFFFSQLVPMTSAPDGQGRACSLSRNLLEPDTTRELVLLGGAHDASTRSGGPGWRPTRFLNQKTGRYHDRDLMVFTFDEPGACTVHDYEYFSGVITTLRSDRFVTIGKVRLDGEATQSVSSVR